MQMSHHRISLDRFSKTFSGTTELSSVALGGRVVSVSDEFFAKAFHLILVEPAQSLKGQFGPNGALYSGWETRRHNPTHDWCIIKLGTSGTIIGFDVDTSHFNGNEAPQVSVNGLHASTSEEPQADDSRWTEVLPKVDLNPNSRHLFTVQPTPNLNYVKLNMYPDGGIARFRVYGNVTPALPSDHSESVDLAHVMAGGRVLFTSDQHFGVGSNLILPGRGKDMGDGWETKRSREKGHKDWAIIQLGVAGVLEHVEVDTAHFKGNFPESCEMHALTSTNDIDWETGKGEDQDWIKIMPRTKLGPHRQHHFQLENVLGRTYTHVKLTIYPDGGIKRIRVIGKKAGINGNAPVDTKEQARDSRPEIPSSIPTPTKLMSTTVIPALPLTPEAFAPFGQVLQAYEDRGAAPRGTRITSANQGSAAKFHKLAPLVSSYPVTMAATPGLSVYRCYPKDGEGEDGFIELKVLERHPFTNQAFIPMGRGPGEGLKEPGQAYLVVAAKNGPDDRPDLKTLRAFVASAAQGIVYNTAIWHQPMTVVDKPMDFTCVESQIGNDSEADCETIEVHRLGGTIYMVKLPGRD